MIRKFSTCRSHRSALTPIHDSLVAFHELSGLQWYACIPAATACLSLLTLPIAIRSRRQQLRLAALQPILRARSLDLAKRVNNATGVVEFNQRLKALQKKDKKEVYARHGVSVSSILALPLLKLPIWIAFSMTLRSMSGASTILFTPLPLEQSFTYEGISWIHDLTAYDSLLALPVLFGVLNLVNVELNAFQRDKIGSILTNMMRAVSVAIIPIAAQMPAAVCLYWTTSVICTILQNVYINVKLPLEKV